MLTEINIRKTATSVVRVNIYYEYLNSTLDLHSTKSPKYFILIFSKCLKNFNDISETFPQPLGYSLLCLTSQKEI